jgi:CDP-glucose 4,6-dehydratase
MRNEFWSGKKVLITGHTGFKGSWLAFWLRMLGADVVGYALAPEATPNLFVSLQLEREIESIIADVRDAEKLDNVIAESRPEIVFHLAAQSLVRRSYRRPVETYATNVMGTVNVLDTARRSNFVRSIVVITTDKVYENKERPEPYRESERLGGHDPYSNSKACSEFVVSAYRDSFFGNATTLIASARAGNVIGGGDWSEDRLLPDVFRSLIFEEKLVIRNPGSIRPWQHVLEPLAGYMLLAERLYNGEAKLARPWNFGPREEDSMPVRYVLDRIRDLWHDSLEWTAPIEDQPHESKILKLDSTDAKAELGWDRKLSLDQALELTAAWYKGFKDKRDLRALTEDQISFYQDGNADKTA